MRKNFLVTLTALIAVFFIIGCGIGGLFDLEKLKAKAEEENKPTPTYTVVVTVSPAEAMVSRGGTQPFTATVNGDNDPSQEVVWSVSGGLLGTSIDSSGLLSVSAGEAPGTVLTVTATSVAYNTRSGSAAATVSALVNAQTPIIINRLEGAAYVVGSGAAALNGSAYVNDGGELSYQWYRNDTDSSAGGVSLGAVNGAQTESYTPGTATAGTVYYYAAVTNTIADNGDGGNKTATAYSNTAAVTVNAKVNAAAPNISRHPAGAAYIQGDVPYALTVEAEAADSGWLTYQWYSNNSNTNSGGTSLGSANGADTASYTPSTSEAVVKYYYVAVTNTINDNGDGGIKTAARNSNTAKIEVKTRVNAAPPNITVWPQGGSYNQGVTANPITVSAASTDGGTISYQWYSKTTGGNTGGTLLNGETEASYRPSTAAVGTMYYYVEVTNKITDIGDGGTKASMTATSEVEIRVSALVNAQTPTITTQPAGNVTYIFNASAAALTVTAEITDTGTLSYQWYSTASSANPGSGGTEISGARESSYIPPANVAGTKYYYVIVTNTNNNASGIKTAAKNSNTAKITVNPQVNAGQPTIRDQPQGATYTHNTAAAALTVLAESPDGGQLSYQWYSNTVNSTANAATLSATGTSYTPGTATVGSMYYYVVVTNTITNNGDGGTKASTRTSNIVEIKVDALTHAGAPIINNSGQPAANTTYYFTQPPTALTVSASSPDGGQLSYQWYSNTAATNSGGASLGSGAQNASYTPSTGTAGTFYFYVVVKNTNNTMTGTTTAETASAVATVKVNDRVNAQPPNISVSPQDATYDRNATNIAALTVTAASPDAGAPNNGTLTYQWYSNTANSTTTPAPASISGATAASYTPPSSITSSTGDKYYFVAVKNTITDNGDGGIKTNTLNSAIAKITVIPITNAGAPTISTQPANKTFTYKDTATALTVSAASPDGGALSYQWWSTASNTSPGSGGSAISGAQSASYTPPTTAAGTFYYYVVVTNTKTGINGTPTAATNSNCAAVTVNKKTVTVGTATHTKAYDGGTTASGVTVTITGAAAGDTVTADSVTASYTASAAGTTSISITAVTLDSASRANYQMGTLPISATVAGITKRNVTLSNVTAAHKLVPFNSSDATYRKETTFSIAAGNLVGSDTVTVGIASGNGLSVSNNTGVGSSSKTITLTYNGTTAVTQITPLSVSLTVSGNDNYAYNGSNTLSVTVFDGQTSSRQIPVTKTNIREMNVYANTSAGRQLHFMLTEHVAASYLRNDLGDDNNWTPIGTSSSAFTGSFDGKLFSITGLKIKSSNQYQGMFGYINGGTVRNLGLADCSITITNSSVGGIAGYTNNTIENCFVTGDIKGLYNVGGIAGEKYGGTVGKCFYNGTVYGTSSSGGEGKVGGIVGYQNTPSGSSGLIENCYSIVDVVSNASNVGGIVGYNKGSGSTVQYCYTGKNLGTNINQGYQHVGGIAGVNGGTVQRCVALKQSISVRVNSQTIIGRVIGTVELSGPMNNNYGMSGMQLLFNGVGNVTTGTSNINGKDGLDVVSSNYNGSNSANWWPNTAGFSSTYWSFGANRLPTLLNMPAGYTQNPTAQ